MGYSYVPLKLKNEVSRIRLASGLTARILQELAAAVRPGVSTMELSEYCGDLITKAGAAAALNGYRGFMGNICTSVNHVAAHGVPCGYRLREGDIISLDLTVALNGWYGDSAVTVGVGRVSGRKKELIEAAYEATMAGINAAKAGTRMGDIGHAIETIARKRGFRVLQNFIGHGIGREIHEEPAVLHCGSPGTGRPVVPGMVFTVEPILTSGCGETSVLKDGWSVVTNDRMPCAQFEHTIAVFGDHTEILTQNKKRYAEVDSSGCFS